jgi:hypothetical protein
MSLPMPSDEQGMTARECPTSECAPGYFKVRMGTGVTEPGYDACYCPYCGHQGDQGDFLTREQRDYAESVVAHEAQASIERMMKETLGLDSRGRRRLGKGLLSVEMTMKMSPPKPVVMPFEEELRRDVTCPHCTLAHAVFGLAVWCADCGKDIFLTHLESELQVLRKILDEVEGRRERLGPRVAARDLENVLEDTVSIFEAIIKFVYRRKIGVDAEEKLQRLRNAFQNPDRAEQILRDEIKLELFYPVGAEGRQSIASAFQKRHAITHNLGVVDRRYLEQGDGGDAIGREVALSARDVHETVDLVERVLSQLYTSLFKS